MLSLLIAVALHVSPAVTVAPKEGPAALVSGVVRDERGEPIAGAKVTLMGGTHHRMIRKEAVTGPDGRFVIADAPPGGGFGTSLNVAADGFTSVNDALELDRVQAFELTVRLGRPLIISGRLLAPDATRGGLRLLHAPPAGAELKRWVAQSSPVAQGSVAPDGTFTLSAPAGAYLLEWSRPAGPPFFANVTAPGKDLELRPASRVLEVTFRSKTGAPIRSADVTLRREGAATFLVHGRADERGVFVATGLDEGEYSLDFISEERCRERRVVVKGERSSATLTTGNGWSLSGEVVDGDGKAVPDANVLVEAREPPPPGTSCFASLASVHTNEAGRFVVPDLELDEVKVTALLLRDESFPPVEMTARKTAPPLRLTLRRGQKRTVKGVVLGPDRQPLEGALVDHRVWTDASGRFTLAREPKDPAVVEVYRRCFVSREVPEAQAATIVLERRPCLSANVMKARQPAPGFHTLTLKRADGTVISTCTTREQAGDCTLEAELGELTLEGTFATGGSASTKVKVTGVQKREVSLELPRAEP